MVTARQREDGTEEEEEVISSTILEEAPSLPFTVWWSGEVRPVVSDVPVTNAVLMNHELMRASDPEGTPDGPPEFAVILPYSAEPFNWVLHWCIQQLPRCCMELRSEEATIHGAWGPSPLLRNVQAHVIRSFPRHRSADMNPTRIRLVATVSPEEAAAVRGRSFRVVGGVDNMRFQSSRVLYPERGDGYADLSYLGFGQAVRYWVYMHDGAPTAVFFDVRMDAFMLLAMDSGQVRSFVEAVRVP
jgi:hypothetical protein